MKFVGENGFKLSTNTSIFRFFVASVQRRWVWTLELQDENFFRSQRLWKIVESRISKENLIEKEVEDDAKALFLLQQALDETILRKLAKFDKKGSLGPYQK